MCVRAEVCFTFQHVHRRLEHLFSALPGRYLGIVDTLSKITGSVLWIRIRSIWKRLRVVSTTLQKPMDSPPSVASVSNGNTNLIAPSEIVEETPTGGDFSEDGKPVLEATADSSATVGPDVPSASSVAGPPIDPVDDIDEESNSDYDTDSDDISDEESFCDRYRRASLFPKSHFPRLLRLAKRNHLSRFQSSDRTPVEVPLYHPPSLTLSVLPSAYRGS
ncbi:hypothetical protein ARMGADRAFT_220110 [Armillaria gallica]|uniref:Uncharacterized protein n=1 Tax=Armillaria gallica TaxID=47427 RepID=A0A2H3E248_ARMGA|nr:hypothetical protein ARMGADRAFT_220110 [Armillaria gallica]